ncbi:MAG TPA: fumarylacetoacetate hydrolase family protein [Solirubrobacterales bacterium]|nr:fumarylacetoacetate hydrolase family protein [Solirubrobacterales bacterium]
MQVARYRGADGEARLALSEGEVLRDAGPAPVGGFVPTPAAWEALRPGRETVPLDGADLLAPLDPPKLICLGLNYRDHADESGESVPPAPLVFAKFPSAVIGHGETIVVPPQESQPDWEAELALVIGTAARDVDGEEALGAIGGYTAMNDVSGRQAQLGDGQWTRGKSFDTFAPLGPALCSTEGLDWAALRVTCKVSGELLQDATTAELVFGVPEIVSYLSHQFTLLPGDVIATGTPAGVGLGLTPQRWLQDGDVVEVEVGAVGPLRNRVARMDSGRAPG